MAHCSLSILSVKSKPPKFITNAENKLTDERFCLQGRPIILCSEDDPEVCKNAYQTIELPHIVDCLQGILSVIPLQLLSFHLAVLRGYDVSTQHLGLLYKFSVYTQCFHTYNIFTLIFVLIMTHFTYWLYAVNRCVRFFGC